MPERKWYREPKLMVPAGAAILVALIGLTGGFLKPDEATPTLPTTTTTTPPAPTTTQPPTTPSVTPPATLDVVVVVLDDTTEERVAGAQLLSDEQGVSRETDSVGRSTVAVRAGLGKLRLTVSKAGYETRNVEVDVFAGMDPVRVRLRTRAAPG